MVDICEETLHFERYFTQLLSPSIRRLPQSFVGEHSSKFGTFFKSVFKLPSKKGVDSALLIEMFQAFILKLNEKTLRPIIVTLVNWACKVGENQDQI